MKKRIAALCIVVALIMTGCRRKIPEKSGKSMYGVWVATTSCLDFPSKAGLNEREIIGEISRILSVCAECGLNAVFLQVRANADALYNASVLGASAALYGTRTPEKELSIDVLDTFSAMAHEKGIRLYAWVNPYRIGSGDADEILAALPPRHPAKSGSAAILRYDGGVCFDPGAPTTIETILAGLREIVEQHEVDGVVFDDYFYPYDGVYDDSATYRTYGSDFKTIGDFRRYSVNRMIAACSDYLKSKKIPFGVSPFGIWRNRDNDALGSDTDGLSAYDEIYADSRCWVKQGWLDFIAPQIYWSFENRKAAFDMVYDWWAALCEKYHCDLAVSHYISRIGSGLEGWDDAGQIARQLTYLNDDDRCVGSIFFRIGDLLRNEHGERQCLKKYRFKS